MKNAFKNHLAIKLFIILLVTFGVIDAVSYISFSKNIRKDEYVSGEAAASFAVIEIDAEKAKQYVRTKETDNEYNITRLRLIDYVQKTDVNRIRVISYTSSIAYNIYDTGTTPLAQKIMYDDYTSGVKEKLVDCRESWSVTRGNVNYTYYPMRTHDDVAVGYIIAESNVVNDSFFKIAVLMTAVSVFLLLIVTGVILTMLYLDYLSTIAHFANSADKIVASDRNQVIDHSIRNMFSTGRSDDLGRLGNALGLMIDEINKTRKNVEDAIRDAIHDGMTDTYNKRYYEEKVDSFKKCSSLLVIYFDVNNLKLMNDTLGHERGDYVIEKAAEYIKTYKFDDQTMIFRMGGDEFLYIAADRSYRDMNDVVDRLDDECPVILSADTDSVKCSMAYGYAYAKGSYVYEQLLSEAEENMYRKKYEIKQQLNMPDR